MCTQQALNKIAQELKSEALLLFPNIHKIILFVDTPLLPTDRWGVFFIPHPLQLTSRKGVAIIA